MMGDRQARPRHAARWTSSVLALALFLVPCLGSEALLAPASRVVLLAGLPGDLESETLYSQQMREWLDVLVAGGTNAEVYVLCDNPGSVALPTKVRARVLQADRKGFLSLLDTLGGNQQPLLVIAWGHGGRQGSTPVFHVRGPRLTPEDFVALAGKAGNQGSRWVLFFPGSGAFARRLAGEGREILSSECDTMFQSDPIGLGVFIKVARSGLTESLEGLSRQAGHGIVDWYEERRLARTEEPTFWSGQEKPKLLASEGVAVGPSVGAIAQAEAATPLQTNSAPPTAVTNLPSAWDGIVRVDADRYPEADGVILRQRVSYILGASPAISSEQEKFIQVLTPEGKRFGDFDVSFDPPDEDLTFLDCEVLQPDGRLVRLEPENIREARQESAGDYQMQRRKLFSLPAVVPGAVLRVHYRTQWKTFPLPKISMEIPLAEELPARDCLVTISVPRNEQFHFALENRANADPTVNAGPYGTSYTWRFDETPAWSHEVLSLPGQRPRLRFSTFPDWASFAEWYARITRLADEVTPAISARAKELTRGMTNDRQRLIALYNYVTGLRYVAVPLGVNSVRPHAAAKVLENQFGDCKDKANLLNTLLRALDIQADLVLVPRFRDADENVPGLAFNHAISRIRLGGETIWLDTTDDVCRFGMLPPGDPGRSVLVIDGSSSGLVKLPVPDAAAHRLELRGRVETGGQAEPLPITLEVRARGFPDYQLRSVARGMRDAGRSAPLLAAEYRPVSGAFALGHQRATRISALDEDFSWRADGVCPGLLVDTGGKQVLHAPFWLPEEWDLAMHQRQAALFLHHGFPLTLDQEFEIILPQGTRPATLPEVQETTEQPLRWRVEWKQSVPGHLLARLRAELARGELSIAETAALQQQLRRLHSAVARDVTLDRQP